jgi:phosphate transport system substrate-binding protein
MIKKIALAVAVIGTLTLAACTQNLTGAGATFPAPLYAKWAEGYKGASGNGVNYQSIGSGGGIKQIKASTVDFGATDKPLKPEELKESGLYQFPTVVGGVVPSFNVPGIEAGKLKLSGTALADIFLGKITKWNDPALAALNPDVKLPDLAITVVHRSDGSGTSFIFTHYLSAVSAEWKDKVGNSDTVAWPVGLGGKGNEGVAAFVKSTNGAIGYVEYAYALKTNQPYAQLQNKSGNFVEPNIKSFSAAAEGADWAHAEGNYMILTDQAGANAWPISGATFILVPSQPKKAAKVAAVLEFFDWAYKNGDQNAENLHYVPLPETVKATIRQQWAVNVTKGGKPVYTPKG